MDWGEFKDLVADKLKVDGDSTADYTNTVWNSAFCKRCRLYLADFAKKSYAFYAELQTVPKFTHTTDKTFGITLKGLSQPVWKPTSVWCDGVWLVKTNLSDIRNNLIRQSLTDGSPISWATAGNYDLSFDYPLASDLCDVDGVNSAIEVSGWAGHPALTENADEFALLDDGEADVAATYIAYMLKEGAASDDVGFARLRTYAPRAFAGIEAIAATRKLRYLQDAS